MSKNHRFIVKELWLDEHKPEHLTRLDSALAELGFTFQQIVTQDRRRGSPRSGNRNVVVARDLAIKFLHEKGWRIQDIAREFKRNWRTVQYSLEKSRRL